MKKKSNQSTMNKIVSGFIGGTILFLILNFIVKPLIEEKKVNKENISDKCEKMNLSDKVENNFLSDLCKKMDTGSQKQQKQSQKKIIEMIKKGSK
jgi:flagellar biosynthesis/type III secretory pathway M-ring protein FliF/YscJ